MKKFLLVTLLVFILCGCSNKEEITKIDEPVEIIISNDENKVTYDLQMANLPEEFIKANLSKEEIENLALSQNPMEIAYNINTVADAVHYYQNANFEVKGGSIKNGFNCIKDHGGEDEAMANSMAYLLEGVFDKFYCAEYKGYTENKRRVFLIMQKGDTYYPVNTSVFYGKWANYDEWLFGFKKPLISSNNIDEVTKSLEQMVDGSFYLLDLKEIGYQGGDINMRASTGEYCLYEGGTICYYYDYATTPVALGEAKLSDKQIDRLLESTNYDYVAKKIKTLPDCINYFVRGDFVVGDGNVDKTESSIGGPQVIELRMGNDKSMCSCVNYLLDGDYDEVGYIDNPVFALSYIKQDGIYYVIRPYDYLRLERKFEKIGHISFANEFGEIMATDDFNIIVDELLNGYIGDQLRMYYPEDFQYIATYSDNNLTYAYGADVEGLIMWYGNASLRPLELDRGPFDQHRKFPIEDIVEIPENPESDYHGQHYKRDDAYYYRGW